MTDFEQWLSGKGVSTKTIRKHKDNVDFYINTFLLNKDATPAKDGASHISMFLGYWFIRKAMWASPSAIRENAGSLKKFYAFMHEQGHIDAGELRELKEAVKEEMAEWVGTSNDTTTLTLTTPKRSGDCDHEPRRSQDQSPARRSPPVHVVPGRRMLVPAWLPLRVLL